MSVLPGSEALVISRLRVVSRGDDPLALRLRVSTLLGAARLEPPGLPPSALVVVRKLVDPLPGALSPRRRGVRPPPDWERAVSSAIDRLSRGAARPALGAVPADAQAVIFVDTAEWLACLATDWLRGLVAERWWWRGLLRQQVLARAVPDTWLAAPESVPAAMGQLADRGEVVAFARALGEDGGRRLLDAVVLRFGLSRVREALDRLERGPAGSSRGEGDAPAPVDDPRGDDAAMPDAAPTRPPRSSRPADSPETPRPLIRAPEASTSGIGPMARAWLGVGLTLARAPAEARSPAFADGLRHWLEAMPPEEDVPPSHGNRPSSDPRRPIVPPAIAADPIRSPYASKGDTSDTPPEGATGQSEVPPPASGPDESSTAGPEGLPSTADGEVPTPEGVPAPSEPESLAPLIVPVVTEFGGVFYLINLGLFLGLYGDFAAPADPGLAPDLWDFVAMVGLRLIGEPIRDDPVWPLLARLAGRDPIDPPGRDFDPGEDWRLPPEWLSAFPGPGDWTWHAEGGRLRVRHDEGFLVLDVAIGDGPVAGRLEQEMRSYPAATLRRGRVPAITPGRSPIERWLDRLWPYLRARLLRALGLTEPDSLGATLCRARARVIVAADRLDVMLSLEPHPIAIRLSGLDRDPGWVPAAGRFVAFHFD